MSGTPNSPKRGSLQAAILFSLIGAAMILVAILELTDVFVIKSGSCLPMLVIGAFNLIAAMIFLRK